MLTLHGLKDEAKKIEAEAGAIRTRARDAWQNANKLTKAGKALGSTQVRLLERVEALFLDLWLESAISLQVDAELADEAVDNLLNGVAAAAKDVAVGNYRTLP